MTAESVVGGAAVVALLAGLALLVSGLAPSATDEERNEIRETQGDRAARSYDSMEVQRRYTWRIASVIFPVSLVLLLAASATLFVRWLLSL